MKITRIPFFLLLLAFVGIADTVIFFDIHFLFLRQILGFIAAIIVPGLLINLLLKVKNINKWEYLLYIVGGSIAFLMLNGLLINWLLPSVLGIPTPLSFDNIFASFNLSLLPLFLAAFLRNKELRFTINKSSLSLGKTLLYGAPLSFPILSSLGAISLNNGSSNIFTIAMLGISAVYIGFITLLRKKIPNAVYPLTLYLISLALLLMLSLRSWHIAGFDISIEYEVFQITKEKMHWALANFQNEYNTCLSITILPTYLSHLLAVKDVYIYKLFFQIIFALSPVGIFLLAKKLKQNTLIAFLAGLFYICNPWFIDPMTTLNRQEIAFFFFIIILLLLFEQKLNKFTKYSLLSLTTFGLVLSHYSSSYITVLLFSGVFFFGIFVSFLKIVHFPFIKHSINLNIKFLYLLFLILATFTWYSVINQSTTNLSDVARNTYNNLPNIFNSNLRTSIIDQLVSPEKEPISDETYQEYYRIKSGEYSNKDLFDTYSPKLYTGYRVIPQSSQQIPVTNTTVATIAGYIYKFSLIMIELFLVIGTIVLIFARKEKRLDGNFLLFIVVCELLLGLIIILPYLSIGYNFDRLYMQVMFILALVEVLGALAVVNLLTRRKNSSLKIISLFYITVFLFTYGLIWQFVGGKTVMWLNNFGYYYNQTFTHTSDYLAAKWMKQFEGNPRVYTTSTGRNILAAYGHKNHTNEALFPSTIETYAFVFVTNTNISNETASFFYRGEHLEYQYPYKFINKQKDLIYSNGGSEIYQ